MAGFAVWLSMVAVLYGSVLAKLAGDWQTDAMYSHGFLVLPIAAWLAWQQRSGWRSTPLSSANSGLWLVFLGLALLAAGTLGAELFLTRISLIPVLAGTIAYVFGWRHLRLVAFPLAFLIFMVPLPTIVFDRVAVALQLVASNLGERMLQAVNVPVLRDGNLLQLPGGTLDVNDACSGIRSIVALIMTATLAGYVAKSGTWKRLALVSAAVPLAIVLNATRVAVTGLTVTRFGMAAAEGFVHTLTGWLVFVGALASLWLVHRALGGSSDAKTALGTT
ncbi:MAG TPA: exosortase/archaeosortase family protein [Vicinamibacterales bacterium]